jgi:thiol-disulfide isomerase/thioredoxin
MDFITNKGESFEQLTKDHRVLLVFLRHFGCTFCRETMCELAKVRPFLEREGVKIVIVHMVESEMASEMLKVYDLDDISHVSDPHQHMYRTFGLHKTGFRAMFGFKNWYRAFVAGIVKGHLVGKPAGDPWQMPGVFLYHKNKILNKFTYRYVSDRPDFLKLARAS